LSIGISDSFHERNLLQAALYGDGKLLPVTGLKMRKDFLDLLARNASSTISTLGSQCFATPSKQDRTTFG
jgi:hypothetical protein